MSRTVKRRHPLGEYQQLSELYDHRRLNPNFGDVLQWIPRGPSKLHIRGAVQTDGPGPTGSLLNPQGSDGLH